MTDTAVAYNVQQKGHISIDLNEQKITPFHSPGPEKFVFDTVNC